MASVQKAPIIRYARTSCASRMYKILTFNKFVISFQEKDRKLVTPSITHWRVIKEVHLPILNFIKYTNDLMTPQLH